MSSFVLKSSEELAKRLLRLGVHKAGGPKAVQEWTGLDTSEVSRLGNDDVDRHIHFSRIIEINEASGNAIIKAWARQCGLALIDAEQVEKPATVVKASGEAIEKSAAFVSTVLAAGADHNCTNYEYRDAEAKKNESIAAIENAFDALGGLRVVKSA